MIWHIWDAVMVPILSFPCIHALAMHFCSFLSGSKVHFLPPWIWVGLVSSVDQLNEMEGTVGSFLSFSFKNTSTCSFLTLPPPCKWTGASLLEKGIRGGEPRVFHLHVANPQTCEKTQHEIAEIPPWPQVHYWAQLGPEEPLNWFVDSGTEPNDCCFESLSLGIAENS